MLRQLLLLTFFVAGIEASTNLSAHINFECQYFDNYRVSVKMATEDDPVGKSEAFYLSEVYGPQDIVVTRHKYGEYNNSLEFYDIFYEIEHNCVPSRKFKKFRVNGQSSRKVFFKPGFELKIGQGTWILGAYNVLEKETGSIIGEPMPPFYPGIRTLSQ